MVTSMLLRSPWGANLQQTLKAIAEAEAYPGPSSSRLPLMRDALHQGRHGSRTGGDEEGSRDRLPNLYRFNPAAPAGKSSRLTQGT